MQTCASVLANLIRYLGPGVYMLFRQVAEHLRLHVEEALTDHLILGLGSCLRPIKCGIILQALWRAKLRWTSARVALCGGLFVWGAWQRCSVNDVKIVAEKKKRDVRAV